MEVLINEVKAQINKGDKFAYRGYVYEARTPQSFLIRRRIEQFSGKTIDYVVEHRNTIMELNSIKKFYPNSIKDHIEITLWKWKLLSKECKDIRSRFISYWNISKEIT